MDGRPNRRNKATFSNFSGVVQTFLNRHIFGFVFRKGWLPFKELYKQASPDQEVGYKSSLSLASHRQIKLT